MAGEYTLKVTITDDYNVKGKEYLIQIKIGYIQKVKTYLPHFETEINKIKAPWNQEMIKQLSSITNPNNNMMPVFFNIINLEKLPVSI